MYKFGEKEFSDQEVKSAFWEKVKERMAWCREKAEDYLKANPRTNHYRLDYSVDTGRHTIYAPFREEELQNIREVIAKDIEENGPYDENNTIEDAFYDLAENMEVDFEEYIPDNDLHWAGGPPRILLVDENDIKHYCRFGVRFLCPQDEDKDKPRFVNRWEEISDEEYVDLLAARLFDENLSFYDLSVVKPELYERLTKNMYWPHVTYMVSLDEIDAAAKKILDSTKEDEEKPIEFTANNPFIGMVWYQALSDEELQKADPELMTAFRLAIR